MDTPRPESAPSTRRARVVALPYESTEVTRKLGTYDVLAEIGRGGMATVYKAYSLKLHRFVAIKVFDPIRNANAIDALRFQNEVMLSTRLEHPHIVRVFDVGEQEGSQWFAMDLLEGGTLARFVRDRSVDLPSRVVPLVIKAARALQYAHEKGIVHRDVKPENVLLDAKGEPFLSDFGIAKSKSESLELTMAGRAVGTASYMPPEQANGELHNIGPHSDVYALGATLYHLLAGVPPFGGEHTMAVLAGILSKEPESIAKVALRSFGRIVPRDLETICLKAMAKEASARYASAAAFADDLQRFVDGVEPIARPASTLERLHRRIRRNRAAMVATLATLSILLVLVVAFGALAIDSANRSSRSLVANALKDALHQASTLERAIRVNMMNGRADETRALLRQLNATPESSIEVARTDRNLAYTDPSTRLRVQKHLDDPAVIARLRIEHPEMLPAIEALQKTAFPSIDRSIVPARFVAVERPSWERTLLTGKPQHYSELVEGAPWLVVLWPIENSSECRICHGTPDPTGYTTDPVRAVLVVRRSQAEVMSTVRENRLATFRVGLITGAALLVLLFAFHRLFGLLPNDPSFGTVARKERKR